MIEFKCVCEWVYIVGKKKVFGPIFDGPSDNPYPGLKHVGSMMSREEWENSYGDCAYNFRHHASKK